VHRSASWWHDWEVGYVGGSVVYVQPEMMKCNSTTLHSPFPHVAPPARNDCGFYPRWVCGVTPMALGRGMHPANGRPCSSTVPKLH
jgi:hypothetical protein